MFNPGMIFNEQSQALETPKPRLESVENNSPVWKEAASKIRELFESRHSEANLEKADLIAEKIEKSIGTSEGIEALIEKHPEKAELWKSQLETIKSAGDPEAPSYISEVADNRLTSLKGQLLEFAAKDALTEAGFDVEARQRVVEGESGGTRPDVIAVNNKAHSIEAFGIAVKSGETLSIECKCGRTAYLTNQLNNHIPNQLSGQEGTRILLTSSDIKGCLDGKAESVCKEYNAKLAVLDSSVDNVEMVIREVARK